MIQFDGKVVLVTGGSRGIGKAISLMFAKAGARVAINYRSRKDMAEETVKAIESAGGEARAFQADLISFTQVDVMMSRILDHFGQLNMIVNNAGIWTEGAIDQMDAQTWHETIATNLSSVFHVCRLGVKYLDGERGDNIVNISSTAGQRGEAFHSHYAASKGGVISFTKSLSTELAPKNIRVNCVAPGWVNTEMCETTFADGGREEIAETIPLRRVGNPEDIAGAVLYLASPLASYITGEILNVNGGNVLCG